jgi:predicted 3-demethylubiquinone-9 3-methyltransferase (glyoxalase superfamily)
MIGEHPMPVAQKINPCFCFNDQAEEAVHFYTGIFKNPRIIKVTRYGEANRMKHVDERIESDSKASRAVP